MLKAGHLDGFGARNTVFEFNVGATDGNNTSLRTLADAAGYAGQPTVIANITGKVRGNAGGTSYALVTGTFGGASLKIVVKAGGWVLGKGSSGGGGTGGRGMRKDQSADVVVEAGGRISGGVNGGANGSTDCNAGSGYDGKFCNQGCSGWSAGSGGGGAGAFPDSGATETSPGGGTGCSIGSCSSQCCSCTNGSSGTALGTNAAIVPNGFGGSLTNNGTIEGSTS